MNHAGFDFFLQPLFSKASKNMAPQTQGPVSRPLSRPFAPLRGFHPSVSAAPQEIRALYEKKLKEQREVSEHARRETETMRLEVERCTAGGRVVFFFGLCA